MSKEFIPTEDPTIPSLKIESGKINDLLEGEIKLKAYHENFVKILQAIANEASPTKKQYYGHYLEQLISNISNDKDLKEASVSRDKMLEKIISFVNYIADNNNLLSITDQANKLLESGQTYGFQQSVAQCINEAISKYLRYDLKVWAAKDPEVAAQLDEQENKLKFDRNVPQAIVYKAKGRKFWEDFLKITEKLFPPKSINFNVSEEAKKFKEPLKKQKNSIISGILNVIMIHLTDNKSGNIIKKQIQNRLCSFDPQARMAQVFGFINVYVKKFIEYIQSKIEI